jgi:transcriptional regulator with XRE-family HTH domain
MKAEPSALRRIVADNVRRLRRGLAMSQEDLASAARLHRTYVGAIERAERNLSLDNIERLALALRVTPADLLTAATPPAGQ